MEIFLATAGDLGVVFDAHSSAQIGTFKGMLADRHCLSTVCMPGHGFTRPSMLVGASKAVLNIHSISKESSIQKLIASEKLSSLSVSHDGLFMAAGLENGMIFVWEFCSGDLLSAFEAHYKAITVLRFTEDDDYLVSGAADAAVHLWSIGDIVDTTAASATAIKPILSFTEHTLEITDLHCSFGAGARTMIWTASMDRTCKLWDIESGGQCLLTLIFPSQPISVLMNRTESLVLIGTFDGTIYRFDLRNHVGANVVHINDSGSSNGEEERRKYAYRGGHQLPVRCLALSLDGSCVYSGCDQGLVNCWDLQSGQKLRSWGPLKGPITNLQLLIKSELLFAGGGNTITELIYPNTLKRSINVPYEGMSWKMEVHNDDYDRNMIKRVMAPPEVAQSAVDEKEQIVPSDNCESDSIAQLQTQIKQLKQINNELYQQLIKQRSI